MTDERYERGLDSYASQFDISREEVPAWFVERLGGRFGTEAIQAAAGDWVDNCPSLPDRSVIVVALLIVQGGVEERLRGHVRRAVEHGSAREELEALVTLLAVYVGFRQVGFRQASAGMGVIRDEFARLAAREG